MSVSLSPTTAFKYGALFSCVFSFGIIYILALSAERGEDMLTFSNAFDGAQGACLLSYDGNKHTLQLNTSKFNVLCYSHRWFNWRVFRFKADGDCYTPLCDTISDCATQLCYLYKNGQKYGASQWIAVQPYASPSRISCELPEENDWDPLTLSLNVAKISNIFAWTSYVIATFIIYKGWVCYSNGRRYIHTFELLLCAIAHLPTYFAFYYRWQQIQMSTSKFLSIDMKEWCWLVVIFTMETLWSTMLPLVAANESDGKV